MFRRVNTILLVACFWLVAISLYHLLTGKPVDWLDNVDGGRYLPRDELVRMSEP